MKDFHVMDEDGNPSWPAGDGDDKPEMFRSRDAAEARALELAASAPGEIFTVVTAVSEARCHVAPPQLTRIDKEATPLRDVDHEVSLVVATPCGGGVG